MPSNLPQSDKKPAAQSRSEVLYSTIRERICLLEYPPGMALREEALAEEFGVSRTPIRSVLQRLEFDGLVAHTSGVGVVVTTIDLKSLKEVYALRLKLAEFIGEMMVTRIPEQEIAAVEGILKSCQALAASYDPSELGRLYNAFSEIMIRLIGNKPLRQISDQLFHQTARVWLDILPDLNWEEEVRLVCQELRDVIAALRANDMKAMAQVRREHMSLLLRRINEYLISADSI